MGIGNLFSSIDLRNVRDPQTIVDEMAFYVRFLPKGRWILGSGWDQKLWASDKLPTKELIDSITPDNPVFIYNSDATMALANSLALKMARVGKNKTEIEGGEIVRDEKGEPTGILKGSAMLFVKTIAPKSNTSSLLKIAEAGTNYAASLGVTSVQDMHSDYLEDVLKELQKQGKLKTRVYDCTPLNEWKKIADKGIKRATGDAMIRVGCLKSFSDGFSESFQQLYEDISNADKNDLQVMMHAIGSRPNDMVLSIYERVLSENGIKDRRFRIEHAYGFNSEDLERYGNSNTIASMQPHLFKGNEPYRSLIKSKTTIAFGSDASITDFNPLLGIHAAVNGGRENISVEEAVRFYTLGSAFAEFQENVKGSITVGKLADLVILSQDIFEIKPEKIRDTEVVMTIFDGKIVYNQRNVTNATSPALWNLP
jgi:predicted amidohydrolase YtcJ